MRKLIDGVVLVAGIALLLGTMVAGAVPVVDLGEYARWLDTPAGRAYSATQAIHGMVGVVCGLAIIFSVSIAEKVAERFDD